MPCPVFAPTIKLYLLQQTEAQVSTAEAWTQDQLLQQASFYGKSAQNDSNVRS